MAGLSLAVIELGRGYFASPINEIRSLIHSCDPEVLSVISDNPERVEYR